MDSKISARFWRDLAGQPSEVKLAFVWCLTNAETSASLIGAFTWSALQFEFETGLEAVWFEKTATAMPRALLIIGDLVWIRNYIRYQFGTGEPLVSSKVCKGLARRMQGLPRGFHAPILEAYPELGVASPMQAPCKGLPGLNGEGDTKVAPSPEGENHAAGSKPLVCPMQGPEKSRAEQSREDPPSGGAGGALVPEESEVVKFARSWPGDAVRGIPAVIPEGWVLSWRAWRMGESAPPFPRDWQADLTRRFVADFVKRKPDTRHPAPKAKTAADTQALMQELAKCKEPLRRVEILRQIKEAAA